MLTRETDLTFLIAAPSTIPKNFLVCTVNGEGPSLAEGKLVAPITLCNIIFFDSVHKVVRKEVNATLDKSLADFSARSDIHRGVEAGFSYSVE